MSIERSRNTHEDSISILTFEHPSSTDDKTPDPQTITRNHEPANVAQFVREVPQVKAGKLMILGTRGIPARHGGFETFAEKYSLFMRDQGWDVSVYCQEFGVGPIRSEMWQGIRRVLVPTKHDSSLGSVFFDLKSTIHASKQDGIILTLGYNTAIFTLIARLMGRKTAMNMDGIEWARQKWSLPARIWLYLNEFIGSKLNHILIADHPEIGKHIARHTNEAKIRVIPYGAAIVCAPENTQILDCLGIERFRYAIVIARPEPENSILEIVTAWSRCHRGFPLVVLGNYSEECPYHREVKAAASDEVLFPGAIYDKECIDALRYYSRIYLHGHRVGGTNPSLVEAMGAGNAIIAHDNKFNRWVAGEGALYFSSLDQCEHAIDQALSDDDLNKRLATHSRERHKERFTFEAVHKSYMDLLEEMQSTSRQRGP